jgi:DNA-binding MarR family transcriptional regulator
VLLRLAEAPRGTMHVKDIADSLLLSRSGLSRVVDELERKGYVARQACPSDARGTEAVITRSGRSAFRKAQNGRQAVLSGRREVALASRVRGRHSQGKV